MLTKKRKQILARLLGMDAWMVLDCLSSEHCEGDYKAFKDTYGVTSDEALKAVKALQDFLEK